MKRISTIILALLMLLASCGAPADTKETTPDTDVPAAEETAAETELTANLPDADYEGYTVTYLTCENYVNNFRLITELTGESLNDAAFNRNLSVEDALNVKFDSVENNGVAAALSNAVAAGDTSYDFVLPHATDGVASMAADKLLTNLYELPVADYTKPWWNDNMMEALAIKDTAYYTSGDIVMTWQGMLAIVFNKDYLADLGITEDLYQTVRDGKWTTDKLMTLADGASRDLNGDGKMSDADQYGYLGNKNTGYGTTIACGQPFTQRDAEGYPRLALNTERMVGIVEKYYNLVNAPYTWMDSYSNSSYPVSIYRSMLIEGRSFFTELDIGGLYSYLREIEFNFGILPLPKYDETQADYQTFCGAGLIGVPQNLTNPERTGAVAEALAYYSYKMLRPAFFDVVLENKAVRDEDSYEMITLMHENKTFDFGFNMGSASIYNTLTEVVINKKGTDFASYYKTMEKMANRQFDKLFESFQ